jgi:hypothetical protein
MESEAIRMVFGDHTDNIRVSSTKSMHGHTLGAAGAIEAAATVLGLHHGLLPPNANFNEPDPECNLNVIANEAVAAEPEAAISNSFAFGGLNAVLAFKRWNGSRFVYATLLLNADRADQADLWRSESSLITKNPTHPTHSADCANSRSIHRRLGSLTSVAFQWRKKAQRRSGSSTFRSDAICVARRVAATNGVACR